MYQVKFVATDSADWAESIELIDDDTNLPLDTTDATFELRVSDRCRASILHASTDLGTVTSPSTGVVQWNFQRANMGGLCAGNTYDVGLTMTQAGGITQIVLGTLTYLEGVV